MFYITLKIRSVESATLVSTLQCLHTVFISWPPNALFFKILWILYLKKKNNVGCSRGGVGGCERGRGREEGPGYYKCIVCVCVCGGWWLKCTFFFLNFKFSLIHTKKFLLSTYESGFKKKKKYISVVPPPRTRATVPL